MHGAEHNRKDTAAVAAAARRVCPLHSPTRTRIVPPLARRYNARFVVIPVTPRTNVAFSATLDYSALARLAARSPPKRTTPVHEARPVLCAQAWSTMPAGRAISTRKSRAGKFGDGRVPLPGVRPGLSEARLAHETLVPARFPLPTSWSGLIET